MEDEDNFDDEGGEQNQGEDPMLISLKRYLLQYYKPVHDPKDADLHFSTMEIHQQLLKLYPNEAILTPDLVANWLHEAGFTFYDYGMMKLEWMMKKA